MENLNKSLIPKSLSVKKYPTRLAVEDTSAQSLTVGFIWSDFLQMP